MNLWQRLRYLRPSVRRAEERDMQEELASLAAMAAPGELGSLSLAADLGRDVWGWTWLEQAVRDVRQAWRGLRHHPGFTAVAVITLGIGIGANAAVFSVVNSVLLSPLPYPKSEELVALRHVAPGAAGLPTLADGLRVSPSMYFTYADHNTTFQSLGVWTTGTANVTGLAEPEQVRTVSISSGVLEALSVPPVIGRWLSPVDQVSNGVPEGGTFFDGQSASVMLSYGYWQRRFGGNPSAVGRTINVNARPRQIIGVMPQGFRVVNAESDLILPLAFDRNRMILAGFAYQGVGRLKPGASLAQANADLARLLPVWMDSWTNGPGTNGRIYETWRIAPDIGPLKQHVVGDLSEVLWLVTGTIGLVMLIAGANVTNLLLVRVESRQQELAVRAALGAGWTRIVRGLLVESSTLGLLGGAVGAVLAVVGLFVLMQIGPAHLLKVNDIAFDTRVLAFTVALSLCSGVILGVIPALKFAGPRISQTLRSDERTASVTRERHRARRVLVIAQVAMAVVLLTCAGLMVRTFQAMRNAEPGFARAEQLQTMRISIPALLIAEPERVTRTQHDIANALAEIPGVTSVGFATELPMEGLAPNWNNIFVEGRAYTTGEIPPLRFFKYVSPGFFRTLGTRLVAGRELTWAEVYGLRPVVMVSEGLAGELWGSPSAAIGQHIRQSTLDQWWEIVGVAQDVRENGMQEPTPPAIYWPTLMRGPFGPGTDVRRTTTFAVRSERAGTEAFASQMRQAVWSVNASLPVADVGTMQDIYDRSLARTSFTLVMLAIAGTMALALGIVGIYGVMSYTVSQRRREIGIRLALGAQGGALTRMFVYSGLLLTGIGVILGAGAAAGLTRVMTSLLFGISPLDPATYVVVPVILAFAAGVASYLPARRVTTVDPVQALKTD